MIYLIGEVSNGARKLADAREHGMGRMFVDRKIDPLPDEPWALDNGVFRAWRNGTSYAERFETFEEKLVRASELAREGRGPMFVVVPDLPADPDSIWFSLEWVKHYREDLQEELDPAGWTFGSRHGLLPLYLAVQDGMDPDELEELTDPETGDPVLDSFAGLFLGGSTDFKATAREWRELADRWDMKLHYGRCTQTRIRKALDAACDSGDSAHPVRLGSDRWARFLEVFRTETSVDRWWIARAS